MVRYKKHLRRVLATSVSGLFLCATRGRWPYSEQTRDQETCCIYAVKEDAQTSSSRDVLRSCLARSGSVLQLLNHVLEPQHCDYRTLASGHGLRHLGSYLPSLSSAVVSPRPRTFSTHTQPTSAPRSPFHLPLFQHIVKLPHLNWTGRSTMPPSVWHLPLCLLKQTSRLHLPRRSSQHRIKTRWL
jgi:hypothetical protein